MALESGADLRARTVQHHPLVHVADLDFMGERARIDDLALVLYFTSLKYLECPVSDHQLHVLRTLVNAYERGLDEPITTVERAALPVAIARQPLWSIGGCSMVPPPNVWGLPSYGF